MLAMMVGHRGVRARIKEFLFHPAFREKGFLMDRWDVRYFVGHSGGEERSSVSW